MPLAGHALELLSASTRKRNARADDQILDGARDDHLVGAGERGRKSRTRGGEEDRTRGGSIGAASGEPLSAPIAAAARRPLCWIRITCSVTLRAGGALPSTPTTRLSSGKLDEYPGPAAC